jgi:hypothetical protein
MNNPFRRFEILLPLRFNDGQAVPPELIADTLLELRQHFGAVSVETQTIRGSWQHQGQTYQDELSRLFLDVADTPENIQFFREFKEKLMSRFRQIDIWVTTYPLEVM